ncbi:hypothetical protein HZY62_10830 [Maribacter polysiphoniae]|uniref:Uncharacterized protein n=1 Tax=Maribacter polysiphoniae TaxID=429344 RepID=A0A316E0Q6_9FLAO|nr:hypothetical protein [Maribacter polysiphoniae]MBD1261084.1 hypothetical protein [Maribacter polysiphoniae]PWK23675.1 hypothetical protein LX92_02242 [Maribacter polysiphoniae]
MKGYLHQIQSVLLGKDVVNAFDFYMNRLDFRIAFGYDGKKLTYAGVIRDAIDIHPQL